LSLDICTFTIDLTLHHESRYSIHILQLNDAIDMNGSDPYPTEPCPFCNIAAAYPVPECPLWESRKEDLGRCVPREDELDVERTQPSSFVVLRSKDVVAFLDILPMTRGELKTICCVRWAM
jgi:hypothetical protein